MSPSSLLRWAICVWIGPAASMGPGFFPPTRPLGRSEILSGQNIQDHLHDRPKRDGAPFGRTTLAFSEPKADRSIPRSSSKSSMSSSTCGFTPRAALLGNRPSKMVASVPRTATRLNRAESCSILTRLVEAIVQDWGTGDTQEAQTARRFERVGEKVERLQIRFERRRAVKMAVGKMAVQVGRRAGPLSPSAENARCQSGLSRRAREVLRRFRSAPGL